MLSTFFARREVSRRPRTRARVSGVGQPLERLEPRLALSLATAFDGATLSVNGLQDQAERVEIAVDTSSAITVNGVKVYHPELLQDSRGRSVVVKTAATLQNTSSIVVDTGGGND